MILKLGLGVAAVVAVLLIGTPSWAAPLRLRGIAASDRGPTVFFVVRLRVNTFTGAAQGRFRCRPRSTRCLFGRGRIGAQFFSDGSFTGQVLAARGSCAVGGSLVGNDVVGRYACNSVQGADTGGFALSAF